MVYSRPLISYEGGGAKMFPTFCPKYMSKLNETWENGKFFKSLKSGCHFHMILLMTSSEF